MFEIRLLKTIKSAILKVCFKV